MIMSTVFFSFITKHKKSSESILNLDSDSWLDSVYIAGNSSLRSSFSLHVFSPAQAYWYTSILIMLTLKLHTTTVAHVNFIFSA